MPPGVSFDWAEDLWHEKFDNTNVELLAELQRLLDELERLICQQSERQDGNFHDDNGSFKGCLAKVAPVFTQDADEATRKELLRMVKQGGGFVEQLLIATITVRSTLASLIKYLVHKLTVTGAGHVNQSRRLEERRDEGDTCSRSSSFYQKQGKRSHSSTSSWESLGQTRGRIHGGPRASIRLKLMSSIPLFRKQS